MRTASHSGVHTLSMMDVVASQREKSQQSNVWGSVVLSGREPTRQCRRHGFKPWPGKTPHAAEQRSLCTDC